MADQRKLLFNGAEISEAEAAEKLQAIYGEKRVKEIRAGLADGTYGCASVAGGHLTFQVPPPPEPTAEATAEAAPAKKK